MNISSFNSDEFSKRHNSISEAEEHEILKQIGFDSTESLIDKTIPNSIKLKGEMSLDEPKTETSYSIPVKFFSRPLYDQTML